MVIKEVIKENGYTLTEVAEKMGITKGAISQIVNGSPNLKTLRAIADIVGCKVGDFFLDEISQNGKSEASNANVCKCPHCGAELHITVE